MKLRGSRDKLGDLLGMTVTKVVTEGSRTKVTFSNGSELYLTEWVYGSDRKRNWSILEDE